MNKKVFVAVTNDISTDQRIHKVSSYLVEKGFEVQVYGRVLPDTFIVNRLYEIVRIKHFFNHNFLFYAEYNLRLFFYLFFRKYDYILANDLDTLPACYTVSRMKRTPLIYDSHEYFVETPELQGRTFVQSFWRAIEKFILPSLKNAITVSNPIAEAYKINYGISMQVMRNLPSLYREFIEEKVSFPTENKVILYQGVLNPGRGIKPMIEALKFLDKVDLVIIGFGKVEQELKDFTVEKGMKDRVHFLGRLAYEKLPNYAKIADIGMVLEQPIGKSFEFSLPNKLFDFIHAGLPIIASPLVEVKNIIEEYKVGVLIENHNPRHIAEKVSKLIRDEVLRKEIIESQKVAKQKLNWENDVKVLDNFFKQ